MQEKNGIPLRGLSVLSCMSGSDEHETLCETGLLPDPLNSGNRLPETDHK